MRQTREEKKEQVKQILLIGLVAVASIGVLGGWFLYIKPRLEPARAENAQHPYFMKYMTSQTKLRSDFNREMTQIGWSHILDFRRAEADPGMKGSLAVVAKAKGIIAQYTRASKVLDDDALLELAHMKGTEEAKKEAKETYVKLTAEPRRMVNRTWEMEGLVVAEVEKIIKLIAPEPRAWGIINGKIVFDLPGTQKEFDACLDRVTAIAIEQEILRTTTIESTLKQEVKQ